ncbi:MAG: phage tail tape measure protein [Leptospiraceae bacterium]|nr:phage tail tape measure protein [Leptospiraceae bacterium]
MSDSFKLGAIISLADYASSVIDNVGKKFDALKSKLGETHSAIQKYESGMKGIKIGGAIIAGGLAIKSSLSGSVDEARKFEKELALLGATANASKLDMDKFSQAAIETGLNTAFSPQEAASGLTALASAGVEGADNIRTALLPAAASSAGKLSIDQAAADMAATMMSFKNQGVSARQTVDTFVNMANVASFSIQDLGSAWRGVNLAASSTNQSLSTTGAVMAALKNAGSTAIESGEGIRMALTALTDCVESNLSNKFYLI